MDNATVFLLKRIAGYKENGLATLGHLKAEHVKDIAKIMTDFATEAVVETVNNLNKGESVDVNGNIFSLKARRPKQKT